MELVRPPKKSRTPGNSVERPNLTAKSRISITFEKDQNAGRHQQYQLFKRFVEKYPLVVQRSYGKWPIYR